MGSLMQAADLPATEFDAFGVGRDAEAIAQALRSLLDAGDTSRPSANVGRWDGRQFLGERVAYVRRMGQAMARRGRRASRLLRPARRLLADRRRTALVHGVTHGSLEPAC